LIHSQQETLSAESDEWGVLGLVSEDGSDRSKLCIPPFIWDTVNVSKSWISLNS
jgi:hypothetical protein